MKNVVFFWDGDAWRMGVHVKSTKRFEFVVTLDEGRGVVLRRYKVADYKARPAYHKGEPYPLDRARQHYAGIGERWGITKGASEALAG